MEVEEKRGDSNGIPENPEVKMPDDLVPDWHCSPTEQRGRLGKAVQNTGESVVVGDETRAVRRPNCNVTSFLPEETLVN